MRALICIATALFLICKGAQLGARWLSVVVHLPHSGPRSLGSPALRWGKVFPQSPKMYSPLLFPLCWSLSGWNKENMARNEKGSLRSSARRPDQLCWQLLPRNLLWIIHPTCKRVCWFFVRGFFLFWQVLDAGSDSLMEDLMAATRERAESERTNSIGWQLLYTNAPNHILMHRKPFERKFSAQPADTHVCFSNLSSTPLSLIPQNKSNIVLFLWKPMRERKRWELFHQQRPPVLLCHQKGQQSKYNSGQQLSFPHEIQPGDPAQGADLHKRWAK